MPALPNVDKDRYLGRRYGACKLFSQEYPTEPVRKISVLQAILELAGIFFTGIANLAGNLMLAKVCVGVGDS